MASWNATIPYSAGVIVDRHDATWMSLQDANLNRPPESSLGWWLLRGPREQVLSALRLIVQTALGLSVERNAPEPADLEANARIVIQVDGEEEEPKPEPMVGVLLRRTSAEIECYVRTPDQDPGPFVNDLLERVRAAILRERDLDTFGRPDPSRQLGSLLYGTVELGYEHPHFNGLEEGRTHVEVFRRAGSEHGAVGVLEVVLQYATLPDAPLRLIRCGEAD